MHEHGFGASLAENARLLCVNTKPWLGALFVCGHTLFALRMATRYFKP